MLLTITTTHQPANDLGYLLHKHPERCQSFDMSFGNVHVYYPEVSAERCSACLRLDVDAVGMVRRKNADQNFLLALYVNDRPYAASSFMSVAIAQVFGSALQGRCKDRPKLATAAIPLTARIDVLPVHGGERFLPEYLSPLTMRSRPFDLRWTSGFSLKPERPADPPAGLIEALGVQAKYVGKNQFDYLIEVETDAILRLMAPDFKRLATIQVRGIIEPSWRHGGKGRVDCRLIGVNMPDVIRCPWARTELSVDYHDHEWGVPIHDERLLFEFLILEGAQAGLSWETILKKRVSYREAFDHFDASIIAKYGQKKRKTLLANAGIVRNKLKIEAAIENARAVLAVQREFVTFDQYIWTFVGNEAKQNVWKSLKEVPAMTTESETMSKDLKRRGFKFVGSTICYAFMQAVGMVNDHLVGCFRHDEVAKASRT